MSSVASAITRNAPRAAPASRRGQVVLSFDVEEHHVIEAASHLSVAPDKQSYYGRRVEPATRWLLDQLAACDMRATFFIVGRVALEHPHLIRDIHALGHEVASHSHSHRMVSKLTPASYRGDLLESKDALEQAAGAAVEGFRAPTFSISRQTPWAIDVLVESGFKYDSSIYPVRHDRYGIQDAPRGPFLAVGTKHEILEIPPATLRLAGNNIPAGGGGYFRIFPLALFQECIQQTNRQLDLPVTMLYFHPWEFDPFQEQLPLGKVSRIRTYMGVHRSKPRLRKLLTYCQRFRTTRAIDLAWQVDRETLPRFQLNN